MILKAETKNYRKMITNFHLIDFAQIILSSFLLFFFMCSFVEICMFLFRIANPRFRFIYLSLSILKLPFDFIFYHSFKDNIIFDLNIFSCQSYIRSCFIHFFLTDYQTEMFVQSGLSLPYYLAEQIPQNYFYAFFMILIIISIFILSYKTVNCLYALAYYQKIKNKCRVCTRKIGNASLKKQIKKGKIEILISDEINIPSAFSTRFILFPKHLLKVLSQKEFEAVIAHELEHLRWYDPLVKQGCALVCAIFWWIPTRRWLKKIEEEQEYASDAGIRSYGLDTTYLASAIYKVLTKNTKNQIQGCLLSQFISHQSTPMKRVRAMLAARKRTLDNPFLLFLAILSTSICYLTIGYRIC